MINSMKPQRLSCPLLIFREGLSRREAMEDDQGYGFGSLWRSYVRIELIMAEIAYADITLSM